jgi:hypothetical protein
MLVGWVGVSAAVGVAGVASSLASMVPYGMLPPPLQGRAEVQPITEPYGALRGALPRGSTVVVESDQMDGIVAAYGFHPLTVDQAPGARAFVPDDSERRDAANAILASSTSPDRRQELLARYDVAGVMCESAACRARFAGIRVQVGPATVIRLNT